jgi:hypothetical protein
MRLKNGDPFDIEGEDGEEITFVMTAGTVDEVIANLDGVQHILKKDKELKFNLDSTKRQTLLATYVFKANQGESFETHVTGNPGGEESIDRFNQVPNLAQKSRRYTFSA